jgi:hypothetical protein
LTGTNKRWVAGILLVLFIASCAPVGSMLLSFYSVWRDAARRCGFSVLAVDVAQRCIETQAVGQSPGKAVGRPVIVITDEDVAQGSEPSTVASSVSAVPALIDTLNGSKLNGDNLSGHYIIPLFPNGWGREKSANTIIETADFGDSLTAMEFSGPLTIIVHSLRRRSDPVRLVALRRAVEYLRHIEEGAVALIVKTHECLGCIPDKMIREVGRLELWDFFPRSPLALYNTNTLIYGRQRTSDVTYGF